MNLETDNQAVKIWQAEILFWTICFYSIKTLHSQKCFEFKFQIFFFFLNFHTDNRVVL